MNQLRSDVGLAGGGCATRVERRDRRRVDKERKRETYHTVVYTTFIKVDRDVDRIWRRCDSSSSSSSLRFSLELSDVDLTLISGSGTGVVLSLYYSLA